MKISQKEIIRRQERLYCCIIAFIGIAGIITFIIIMLVAAGKVMF